MKNSNIKDKNKTPKRNTELQNVTERVADAALNVGKVVGAFFAIAAAAVGVEALKDKLGIEEEE